MFLRHSHIDNRYNIFSCRAATHQSRIWKTCMVHCFASIFVLQNSLASSLYHFPASEATLLVISVLWFMRDSTNCIFTLTLPCVFGSVIGNWCALVHARFNKHAIKDSVDYPFDGCAHLQLRTWILNKTSSTGGWPK